MGDLASEAEVALGQMLARSLEETVDWNHYLAFLEQTEGDPYPRDRADEFDRHARDELARWSPSPPNLDDLMHHARGFGLDELIDELDEKAREDEERDSTAGEKVAAVRSQPGRVEPRPEDGDEVIERLFSRL